MQVFVVSSIDSAPRVSISDADLAHLFRGNLGRAKAYPKEWKPVIALRLKRPRERSVKPYCDISFVLAMEDVPLFSLRAKTCLEPVLGDAVQWLPLEFDEKEFWLVNVLETVAIDNSKANIKMYDGKPTSTIETYAFNTNEVFGKRLFKESSRTFSVLCTAEFKETILKHKLTGFFFECVWDSRYAPFSSSLSNSVDIKSRPEIFGPDGVAPIPKQFRERFWPPEWFDIETLKK